MEDFYLQLQSALGCGQLWIKIEGPFYVVRWNPDRNHKIELRVHEDHIVLSLRGQAALLSQRIAENMRIQYRYACGVKI